jgi:magnesium-transporting ATPase (P-type)
VALTSTDLPAVDGTALPDDDRELGQLIDHDGAVIVRVAPEDKLRIARVLQMRGHVVTMTGDGVNDAPALRQAHVGVAMGEAGSDVAREAADLVLLDDHFATIARAIELGRATFANIRRFLTYHLTDNVAELTPFIAWALSAGAYPLTLSVLQVLAIDIGTDLLPAAALGAEPPNARSMQGPPPRGGFLDGKVARRALLVLGPVEAMLAVLAGWAVLVTGGWTFGAQPSAGLLASASGATFATVVLGQAANAFVCRSEEVPVLRQNLRNNHLLLGAVATELVLLVLFVVGPVAGVLGAAAPPGVGWVVAVSVIPTIITVDALHKAVRRPGTFGPVRQLATRGRVEDSSSRRQP